MTHIDKQLGVHLDFVNQKPTKSDYSKVELYSTIILIVLGFGGLYFYTSILNPEKPDVSFSSLTANTFEYKGHETASAATKKGASSSKLEQLIVKGHPEAGEKLIFIIAAYDENADYNIAFGDGVFSTTTQPEFEHTYNLPGNYKVELNVSYEDESAKKVVKEVIIDQPIEIIEEPYTEM